MTPEQFAYWLQGFAELNGGGGPPTPAQWAMIREHLQTVFDKVTPPLAAPPLSFPSGARAVLDSSEPRAIC